MARISTPDVDVAIGNGTTWGTARDLTGANVGKLLHLSNLSVSDSFTRYEPRDIGFDLFKKTVVNLNRSVQVSITCDLAYDEMWLQLAAAFLGTTTSSPAEQTPSQGDYLHNIDWANSNFGKFVTIAWKVEDDYVLEIPSIKIMSMEISADANSVGTVKFTGIGDRVVDNASAANTQAEIDALSYPSTTFRAAPLGGTNHYFKINSQSGGALSTNSDDDKKILKYSLSMNRPMQTRFALNGASSAYTLEPIQTTPTTGSFSFQLFEIDNGTVDGIVEWLAKTEKKAALYTDGDIIGSTLNRSIKIQMPRLVPSASMPQGYDVPNNSSIMTPTFSYDMLYAASAPTGMSGVQSMRIATSSTRVQSWLN